MRVRPVCEYKPNLAAWSTPAAPYTNRESMSADHNVVGRNSGGGPAVSVVMPVHNALPHLDKAVQSILGQTFTDFEFVILDDASTDGSLSRLKQLAATDDRIRLLQVATNLGPALSSDRVAREAKAPIVARMDADDVAYPTRLAEQLELLRRFPDVGVIGSLCDVIDARGRKIRGPEHWRLGRNSPFVPFPHGATMYRRSVFERVGGYRRECEYWEDQDLITQMSLVSRILVLPYALYQVRQSTTSTRVASDQDRLERAVDLMYRAVERLEAGAGYDGLLHQHPGRDEQLDPRVFISLGSVLLWAGGRPRLFRRLIDRGRLRPDFRSFSALVWTAWASLHPSTLRLFLRSLLKARNSAGPHTQSREPVEWRGAKQRRPSNAPLLREPAHVP